MIIRGHKLPQQNNLNKFYKAIGEVKEVPTSSAYSQARQKLKGEVFLYLNDLVNEEFYGTCAEDEQVKRWEGRRLIGVDGTYLNVPDTAQTRQRYSLQRNQHEGGDRVQALGTVAYDLLNNVGLSAVVDRKRAEKEFLFESHIHRTEEGDILVLDRLNADYGVMAFLIKTGRDFVIRFPRGGFKPVREFWDSEERDQVVRLKVNLNHKRKGFVTEQGLDEEIGVRLIKVELDNGEVEVLGTSLVDGDSYKAEQFKEIYNRRWAVETYFDRIKNIFEVERFSGQSVVSIEQDFYGVIFLSTLQSILSKEAEQELKEQSHKPGQYMQQVNQSVGYSAMLDYVIELLVDKDKNVEQTLEELHHLFKTNPIVRRDGRKFPRKKASSTQKLWFYRYTKRIIA